ncbi:hypothetical protein D4764_13G0002750 [Takifugu flavidus]|uniref:Uncharacterized protein n=1 Tax=Takifugu flavidus TaxID=433684 RepID=A0A5C6P815_9TELE|nr:hypothetical protein D4764_13G0002750 [Takifugu flavidus]
MLRFPVKKIRKQFKLLLLLVLLTSAVWFTYLHINQGKTIKLHFNYGKVPLPSALWPQCLAEQKRKQLNDGTVCPLAGSPWGRQQDAAAPVGGRWGDVAVTQSQSSRGGGHRGRAVYRDESERLEERGPSGGDVIQDFNSFPT